jgi:very-short-patch-repair endonuclease
MDDLNPAKRETPIIDAHVVAKTTFAAAQNAVPVIKQILIRNETGEQFTNLRLSLSPQPAFCRPKEWIIDRVPPGETIEVGARQITLDFAVLDKLNEAEHGQLVFKLLKDEAVLDEQTIPIELLARDEWGGSDEMAQILAAFVSPNHAVVSSILKEGARLLERGGHKGSLDGYQSRDPRRAYMLAAAIWSAVSSMDLSYAQPPRSFEKQGQKIRDPGSIKDTGLATCLDTTLLLAAAFEAAGLNPVVVFMQGHAFVGVWLIDKTFPLTIEPDVMEVRKAVAAREFRVLETTLLTHRPAVSFEQAMANGEAQLSEDAEKPFHLAIDIARARAARIRPISSRDATRPVAASDEDSVAPAALPSPPSPDELPVEYAEALTSTPDDRLDRWQKKLLDLSLRNRLLNFSATRQTLKLICADVAALEDALAAGDKFRVISIKDENPIGNRDPQLYRQQTGKDIELEFAATAFDKGQVCAAETGKEMQSRLTTLFRKAKSDLAEGGANTLFMAVGFLRWKKTPTDERTYRAPLLLLPVKLSRRSANSNYYLSHHEDDVVFNQTLLEFLERDFGLSIPALRGALPEDHSGLDIKQIFTIVKHAVRDAPGFEVVEEIALSTFSFAKYLMWKDLVDRTDSLKNNRLVKHLLDNPTEPFRDGTGDFPSPETIDQRIDPAKLYTPLPADSSQLAAIVAAEAGKDFVIIGPPGTGKSQTIANMIAHCLAHGKTVLFVAEKAAALDVVYRRLKAYGLSDACLELHSNKSDRKSVIAQLGAAWDRVSAANDSEWIRLTESLNVHRDELNQYVSALHEPGSHGRSVFEGIGILSGKRQKFALSFAGLESHDRTSFNSLIDLVDRLALAHKSVKTCGTLDVIEKTEWSFAWQAKLLEAAARFGDDTVALVNSCHRFGELLGLPSDGEIHNPRLSALTRLAKVIGDVAKPDIRFAASESLSAIDYSIVALEKAATDFRSAQTSLAARYEDSQIQRMPLEEVDQEWRRENAKLWPLSLFGKLRVKKLLQSYAAEGKADPESDIQPLMEMQAALQAAANSAAHVLPRFDGVRSDTDVLRDLLEQVKELHAACAQASQSAGTSTSLLPRLGELLPEDRESCAVALAARELTDSKAEFKRSGRRFMALAGGTLSSSSLGAVVEAMNDLQQSATKLNDWVKWSQVKQEAEGRGLSPMVEALSAGVIDDPVDDFLVAYFTWWLPLAIDQKPKLRSFVHWEQENQIERFRSLIDSIQRLAASQVRRAVSHDLPTKDGVPRKSELGLLRHQLGLQRPSESIRGLIVAMPETFTKLTPCVLMSPLSVAQYLPTEQATFDMVIFDEASQITTWDAVGSIARGKQSIIVGDPKQLPPTNFFGRTDDETDDDLEIHERDLPSILDEASAAGLPLHQLNWHYRSRDEGLIAFSNHHYYGQRLVTFPSPATESKAVQFHPVDGVYARGSGRTNEIEARAVVEFVVRCLEQWSSWSETDRLSIGVITFNAPQQELILDLLDAERARRPRLEWFFSDDREEPVIVKNLENVQGDERDVMVFSITFGRDHAGKLSMDFGAVNREGGEKRLNVAVTRAKSEFHVFSSISAEDIDLRRGKGVGVSHLKSYLDYAERGSMALATMDEGSLGPAENAFEASVADALQSRGWEVRTQIGVSGYRIDLGVVHPDKAGAYLAGIECDGATYHRSASARDRDQIREGVLRNLGWEILRVWSTDWFMHPDEALVRIDTALKELLERRREEARQQAEVERDRLAEPEAPDPGGSNEPDQIDELDEDEAEGERQELYASQQLLSQPSTSPNAGQDDELEDEYDSDESLFFEPSYSSRLTKLIDRVVAKYGPMSETMLYRHIAKLHGWQRAGRRIQERVMACIGENECRKENGNMFVWRPGSHREMLPFRPHLRRAPRDVPQAEIIGLIDEQAHVLRRSDPAKDIATLMGLGRLSADTRAYLDLCIAEYERRR